jgi:hypothetical protein
MRRLDLKVEYQKRILIEIPDSGKHPIPSSNTTRSSLSVISFPNDHFETRVEKMRQPKVSLPVIRRYTPLRKAP